MQEAEFKGACARLITIGHLPHSLLDLAKFLCDGLALPGPVVVACKARGCLLHLHICSVRSFSSLLQVSLC